MVALAQLERTEQPGNTTTMPITITTFHSPVSYTRAEIEAAAARMPDLFGIRVRQCNAAIAREKRGIPGFTFEAPSAMHDPHDR
jgi:hypothetical protein